MSVLHNHCAYQEIFWREHFGKTLLYKQLQEDFDYVVFDKHFPMVYDQHIKGKTPRERYAVKQPTYFSAVPFYYLQYLDCNGSGITYDLGCGANFFKNYLQNVVGIGAEDPCSGFYHGDFHGRIDTSFVSSHQNFFESVFSINALHFCPLTDLTQVVENFASMIKPNGKGYLALNLARMIELDSRYGQISTRDGFETGGELDLIEIESQVRSMIGATMLNFQVVDIDFSYYDNWMDGNIRLVIKG